MRRLVQVRQRMDFAEVDGMSVPMQLEAEAPSLVDRVEETAVLHEVRARPREARAAIAMVGGRIGVGKSTLAFSWCHQVRSVFQDGVICFDFRHGERKLEDAVAHCFQALGITPELLSPALDDRIAALRTLTAQKDLLFFFDNVGDGKDVLRLLPASPGSMVLCTTSQLDPRGLVPAGVHPIWLNEFTQEHAVDYLRRSGLETRIEAEPEATAELVRLCEYLPKALEVMAELLNERPFWRIEQAVQELSDSKRRRTRLTEVLALDVVVPMLSSEAQRLYRLLGSFPGPVFGVAAVAAFAGIGEFDARNLLEELRKKCLVEVNNQGQYQFHDLVRLHAEEAARDIGADERERALRRSIVWYRRQGALADQAVMEPTRLRVIDHGIVGDNPFSKGEALEWLESERLNLLALVEVARVYSLREGAIALCEGPLWALHNNHKHYSDMLRALEQAIRAAVEEANAVAEARLRSIRGQLWIELDQLDDAEQECELAVVLAERAGARRVLASALEFRGKVWRAKKEFTTAVEVFERSWLINLEVGRPRGMAIQEYLIGTCLIELGELREALAVLHRSLDRFAEFPEDRRLPNRVRTALGSARLRMGQPEQAIPSLQQAVSRLREEGASFDLAEPLELLADACDMIGRPGAKDLRAEALGIYEQAGSPKADRVRRKLSEG
ncbi:tetratricopeptide repeat protein [Saccharopolyspora hirsuta]|uniref:tetratricopeptide repeat protein n=1 Tax=Saccharopolyspora hirsuta TaxID=1837 RepID=UPI00332A1164